MKGNEPIAHLSKDCHQRLLDDRCMVVDVETTGLSPRRGDRVIEIGAISIQNKIIVEEFHTLIQINKRIPMQAQQIHGITNAMLVGKPKPEEVFPRFRAFIADSVLVAHNAQFDVGFLRHEFGRLGFGFDNRYVCTLEMSRAHFPRLRDHKLQAVYRHLFREPIGAIQQHRALDDARMVARVWMELMKR